MGYTVPYLPDERVAMSDYPEHDKYKAVLDKMLVLPADKRPKRKPTKEELETDQ